MRLGQLSRKLSLRASDIQSFLTEKKQAIEGGLNSRLTDDQVLLVVRHFAPSQEVGILDESVNQDAAEEPAPAETPSDANQEGAQDAIQSTQEQPLEAATEVIRAPKQELPGLKVVGKIELREARKKESSEPPVQGTEPAPDRPLRPIRKESPQRSWRNPLEVQRQREAEERRQHRKEELEREKERRTQNYLKKVKSAPTRPVRRQEETVVETQVESRPAPRTWLGKFARWLTT